MVKIAVIVAAGLGSRLQNRIEDKPKGFLMISSKPIVEESVIKLIDAGIEKIIIGTGHLSEAYEDLAKKYPKIVCVRSDKFSTTGSMYTLYNARDYIDDDFLLLESDLIYDKKGLKILLDDHRESVILASEITDAGDAVFIEVDENKNLVNMSKNESEINSVYAELVGINKISLGAFKKMCVFAERIFEEDPKLDYEYALVGISKDEKIFVNKINNYLWCEIDDDSHLERATKIIYPKIEAKEQNEKKN